MNDMTPKQHLIALLQHVIPDDATQVSAEFKFRDTRDTGWIRSETERLHEIGVTSLEAERSELDCIFEGVRQIRAYGPFDYTFTTRTF